MSSERHRITKVADLANVETVRARFHARVDREAGPDGCWPWLGSLNHDGYGTIALSHGGGRTGTYLAHRVGWMLEHGEMPAPGLVLRHACIGNRACCNPRHLLLGAQAENIDDRQRQGRTADRRGERGGNARLTPEQVLAIRVAVHGGQRHRELVRGYGVSADAVGAISRGKRWGHLPRPGEPGWEESLAEHGVVQFTPITAHS